MATGLNGRIIGGPQTKIHYRGGGDFFGIWNADEPIEQRFLIFSVDGGSRLRWQTRNTGRGGGGCFWCGAEFFGLGVGVYSVPATRSVGGASGACLA